MVTSSQRKQASSPPSLLRSHVPVLLLCSFLLAYGNAFAVTPLHIPMKADNWSLHGDAAFTSERHGVGDVLEIKKGSAELRNVTFGTGTIDYDMYMPDHGILGIRFHQKDKENAEALYFRPQANCANASDCIQYMPLEHGAFEWDLFPEDQAKAPIRLLSWNHIRIEIGGRHMRVYINGAQKPTLRVTSMEGGATAGTLSLGGPAKYANLVITPSRASAASVAAPNRESDGFLRHWQVSTASVLPTTTDPQLHVPKGTIPAYPTMPSATQQWKNVTAETKGLVNFSRDVGSAKDGAVVSVAWAKTTLTSDRDQVKQVSVGWVREIWIYVNGKLLFADRNLEGLPAGTVAGERISLGNGSIRLPLRKGINEIAIALDDNLPGNTQHYGWGMEMKLNDLRGLSRKTAR